MNTHRVLTAINSFMNTTQRTDGNRFVSQVLKLKLVVTISVKFPLRTELENLLVNLPHLSLTLIAIKTHMLNSQPPRLIVNVFN